MKTHQRRQQRRQAAQAGQRFGGDPVALVRKIKSLADQVGGIRNLKQLVDLLVE
jgi:ribosomal protein S2